MAFLTTGVFYEVDFLPTSDAAWAALGTVPAIPATIADAIVNGTTIVIYVINSGLGQFAFVGGSAIGFDDTVLNSNSSLVSITTTADDGWTFDSALDSGSLWNMYDPQAGYVRAFTALESAALKAFL